MAMLLFYAGQKPFVCSCNLLVEVVPFLPLPPLNTFSAPITGMLHYRETVLPVLDFTKMHTGHPSLHKLSTRILIAHQQQVTKGLEWMGILVERALSMVPLKPEDFIEKPIHSAPYIKGSYVDESGMIIDYVDLLALFEMVDKDETPGLKT